VGRVGRHMLLLQEEIPNLKSPRREKALSPDRSLIRVFPYDYLTSWKEKWSRREHRRRCSNLYRLFSVLRGTFPHTVQTLLRGRWTCEWVAGFFCGCELDMGSEMSCGEMWLCLSNLFGVMKGGRKVCADVVELRKERTTWLDGLGMAHERDPGKQSLYLAMRYNTVN
jgi:hypothetical protein